MSQGTEKTETVNIDSKINSKEINQWARNKNMFYLVGETVDELEPGLFTIGQDNSGNPIFKHEEIKIEGLMKLDEGNTEEIISDICEFWEKEEHYAAFKIPFKRGIMMSGPPGTGKTCIIKLILADMIQRGGICIEMDPRDTRLFTRAYENIRKIQPNVPIVAVIEDFNSHMVNMPFLNMMDGLVPLHKVVIIGTTNYPEELPDTILNRPGRFDTHFEIPFPSENAREALLKTLIPEKLVSKIDLKAYVKDSYGMSMGHLKELVVSTLLMNKSYKKTVDRLKAMREGIKENENEEKEGHSTVTSTFAVLKG